MKLEGRCHRVVQLLNEECFFTARKGHGGLHKPQHRKKVESEQLRGDRDQIKFIYLRFKRWQVVGLSELCWGKAVVAYTKPQQRKKEESKRLRGERDQIKFIYLRFERWQVVGFRKARKRQDVP